MTTGAATHGDGTGLTATPPARGRRGLRDGNLCRLLSRHSHSLVDSTVSRENSCEELRAGDLCKRCPGGPAPSTRPATPPSPVPPRPPATPRPRHLSRHAHLLRPAHLLSPAKPRPPATPCPSLLSNFPSMCVPTDLTGAKHRRDRKISRDHTFNEYLTQRKSSARHSAGRKIRPLKHPQRWLFSKLPSPGELLSPASRRPPSRVGACSNESSPPHRK